MKDNSEAIPKPDGAKLKVLVAQAMKQAMTEFISEHRTEIVKRGRAKLVAMGITFEAEDVNE